VPFAIRSTTRLNGGAADEADELAEAVHVQSFVLDGVPASGGPGRIGPEPLDESLMAASAGRATECTTATAGRWTAVEPRYQARLASFREEFEEARSKGLGSEMICSTIWASWS
jgi:hypothetical protein